MKKTLKSALALAFCVVTIIATMLVASAIGAPKAKVSAVTYNSVTVTWNAVSGADFYQIQRSTDGKNWSNLSTSVKGTSYTDSKSLVTGKSYAYRVRSADKGLLRTTYSAWTANVVGKPLPAQVTGLKVTATSYNAVKIAWNKVTGATGYAVQIYSGGKWKAYKATTANSLLISNLKLGSSYYFRVLAYRTVSGKAVYGAASATLKTAPALAAPTTVVLRGVTNNSLTLAWSAVSGAQGYQVYNSVTKTWTNAKTARTLTLKNLKPGTKYGFYVRAYYGKVYGKNSAARVFVTTPAAPAGVKVTATSPSAIAFSWNATAGATGYQAAIYDHTAKKWTYAVTKSTAITMKSLTSASKYTVQVRAYVTNTNVQNIAANSYGAWSTGVATYTNPAAVKNVYLRAVTTNSINLSWSASTGATGYQYYNPVSKAWVSTGTSRVATITGLQPGTKYAIKVRAVLNKLVSPDSATYNFITTPLAPTELTNSSVNSNGVVINNSTKNSVTLTWNAVTGATMYKVQYSTNGTSWTSAGETATTSMTISNLSAATSYKVRVCAYAKNSNVYGISEIADGDYTTADARTLAANTAKLTATGSADNAITLSWPAVNGASGYIIEKFDIDKKDWTIYDFKTKKWSSYDSLDSKSVITTADLSFTDSGYYTRSDIYRFRTTDANGYASEPSAVVNASTQNLTVTVNSYGIVIEWPKVEGATSYKVYTRYPSTSLLEEYQASALTQGSKSNTYKLTLNLAPESIHSIMIFGTNSSSSSSLGGTNSITFVTGALPTGTTDAAKNAQLLYLARAINDSKDYTQPVTVRNISTINYTIQSLSVKVGKLSLYTLKTPQEIEELFNSLEDSGESFSATSTEKFDSTLTFTDGKATNNNRTVRLRQFLEPSTSKNDTAKLPDGHKTATGWKNGISAVTTTTNSDNSRTIKVNFKQENGSALYHNGFISTFSASDIGGIDGFEMKNVKVGASTLTATIGADGILKTYVASAPFSATVSSSFTATESSGGVTAGSSISIEMSMSGSTSYNITLTK